MLVDRDRLQFGQVAFRYEGAVPRVALALPAAGRGFQAEMGVEVGVPENFRNLSPISGKATGGNLDWLLWAGAGVAGLGLAFYVFRMFST